MAARLKWPVTHQAFNKLAVDKSNQFSGYGKNRCFNFVLKSTDAEQLKIISSMYHQNYFKRLQNKVIKTTLVWDSLLSNNYTIGYYLEGIDPEKEILEAPGSINN